MIWGQELLPGEIIAKATEHDTDLSIGMELIPFLGDVTKIVTDDQLESNKNDYILWALNGNDSAFSEEGFWGYLKNIYSDIRRTGNLLVFSGTGSVINKELNVTGLLTTQGADGGLLCLSVNMDDEFLSDSQKDKETMDSLNSVKLTAPVINAGCNYDGSDVIVIMQDDDESTIDTERKYRYINTKQRESHPDGIIVCPIDNSCPITPFTDADKNEWYHDGVHWALEKNIMNGTSDSTFEPMTSTTRAMIVTMLWRMEGSPQADGSVTFKDVPDGQWYTDAIRWAASNGIVTGYDSDTFGTNDSVTREQLATILYRSAQTKAQGFTGTWAFPLNFDDTDQVSEWADEAMHWMTMNGVIQGVSDKKLYPKSDAVRAQVATMLMRFSEEIRLRPLSEQ